MIVVLSLVACETLHSVDVTNAELALEAVVATDGLVTEVEAKVTRGQGLGWTPVHVSNDESLVGFAGDDEAELEAVELQLGDVGYSTTFESASGGLDAGIRFDRTADDPIDDTSVTVPDDFEFTAPVAGAAVAADAPLLVLWPAAAAGGTVDLTFSGDCIPGWQDTPNDVGSYEIPADALAAEGGACAATLTLVRSATGTIGAGWGAGGSLSATNGRNVVVAVGS